MLVPGIACRITLKRRVIKVFQKGKSIVWPKNFVLWAHPKFITKTLFEYPLTYDSRLGLIVGSLNGIILIRQSKLAESAC